MQSTPEHLSIDAISRAIAAVPGVEGVGHLHIWPIDEDTVSLEGRIAIRDDASLDEITGILGWVEQTLARDHDIPHVTLQPVPASRPPSPIVADHRPEAQPG